MGLDMYLQRRIWVGSTEREHLDIRGLGDLVDPTRVCYVIEDIGGWRKANAIHRWFVEQVQHGQDDCHTYGVTREQLRLLLGLVERVLAHPDQAAQLLPTQGGFYFGETTYSVNYVESLRQTQRIIREALAHEDGDFEYGSSW
jgi:hypothetical protein